ncbi:hypothetical protein [uncultured Rothia sp.]|jgi:hypothetical protein|uniref:hypothetical protein n=1 Tax=uncultured Rothia sp. TaxID=316088 RepID=UPI0028D553F1|nr:hypothetical protein [uncultured Rothia sp.]
MNERDHEIPASVIGRFAAQQGQGRPRDQEVSVRILNKERYSSIETDEKGYAKVKADDIGWGRGSFDANLIESDTDEMVKKDKGRIIDAIALDESFKYVESEISKISNEILRAFEGNVKEKDRVNLNSDNILQIPVDVYKNYIIKYVAQMMVRSSLVGDHIEGQIRDKYDFSSMGGGEEYDRKSFERRGLDYGRSINPERVKSNIENVRRNSKQNFRVNRISELEKVLLNYKPTVLFNDEGNFILPDIGVCPIPRYKYDGSHPDVLFSIPLASKMVILLCPSTELLCSSKGMYYVPTYVLKEYDIDEGMFSNVMDINLLNKFAVSVARDFYVGSKDVMMKYEKIKKMEDGKLLHLIERCGEQVHVSNKNMSKKSNSPKSVSPTGGKVPGIVWLEAIEDGKGAIIKRKIVESGEDFNI